MIDLFGKIVLVDTTTKRYRIPSFLYSKPISKNLDKSVKNCEHFKRYRNRFKCALRRKEGTRNIRTRIISIWFKCALRRKEGPATDHRANYTACGKFVAILPTCPGCGAERLDECNCPLKSQL